MITAFVLVLFLGDPPATERVVLRLADGSCLRVAARAVDGGFEVRAGDAWRRIDAKEITSARSERELVDQARLRLGGIAPAAYGMRVEAVRWMIAEGLLDEAVRELDRILLARADERHVIALFAEPATAAALARAPGMDIPAEGASERDALLRAGARLCNSGSSPTKRELAVRALVVTTPVPKPDAAAPEKTLLDDLTRELEAGATTRRAFACLALRRLYRGRALGELSAHAVFDPALDVRDGAIAGLADARDPAACGAVVRALASPNQRIRSRAAEALGRMGYREAVEPLIQLMLAAAPAPAGASGGGPVRANLFSGLSTAYVQDYDMEIAQGASVANPIIAMLTSGVVFDVGVGGVSYQPVTVDAWDAASALTRLTGQRFGTDVSAWQTWWAEHRNEYVPASRRTPRTGEN